MINYGKSVGEVYLCREELEKVSRPPHFGRGRVTRPVLEALLKTPWATAKHHGKDFRQILPCTTT